MKNRIFYPVLLMTIAVGALILLYNNPEEPENSKLPNDWFYAQRAYPTGKINHEVYVQTLKEGAVLKDAAKGTSWDFEGPVNIGGRLSDVEYHPCDDYLFVGTASGGVFRYSIDSVSFVPVFDDALSLSIGDIAIAPSDCNILYVGTGEANCGGGSQTYDGVGVYRSNDKGDTWEHVGLEESRNIGRIVVHPQNPDIVYVAAMGNLFGDSPERGIYKSENGGETWNNILYISDSTGGIDLVIDPDFPETLYAAMWERVRRPDRRSYGGSTCGLFKTADGGNSWVELTNGLPSPGNDVGRIGVDISRSDPNILYAIYADKTGYFEGVYKTYDGGENWSQTNDASLENCYQSYGWWFGRIKVDPVNPGNVYVIGFDLHKTSTGGNSWENISEYEAHVDQHELVVDPTDNNRLFLGNDGGLYISEDGGSNWDWIDIFPLTQFYTCEVDNQFPERLYGGTQDNGTNRTMTGAIDDWENIYGGDGFYVLVDPENNNYIYAEYQYGNLARSTNGGNSFNWAMNGIGNNDRKNWCTPVVFDPTDPEILYYGSNKMYRSENRAVSWSAISTDLTNGPGVNLTYGTITTISVSPVDPEIIYVGTDDGNVWVSAMNGMGWSLISSELPDRWVTRVAADPTEENAVYVTFSGYRWDEFLPHIFRSDDKGENWTDISSNLPETPLNDVIVDPDDNEVLYVASDIGVFVSKNKGESWNLMGDNLPMVPVNDLVLHNNTRKLVAATFGRSMYSYDLYQDTITTTIQKHDISKQLPELIIYPNPVQNQATILIENPEKGFVTISIFNIQGMHVTDVYKGVLKKGKNEFEFIPENNLFKAKGTYTIVIQTSKGMTSQKFIYQ